MAFCQEEDLEDGQTPELLGLSGYSPRTRKSPGTGRKGVIFLKKTVVLSSEGFLRKLVLAYSACLQSV